jgi:RNA polymerase sigma-70 factor (ECF subfamily)
MTPDQVFENEVLPVLPSLRGVARRYGDADDLLQETCLRALQARHRYRPGSHPRAWLYRILVNVAVSEHRRLSRERRATARLAEVSPRGRENPVGQKVDLHAALARLPAADRQMVEHADVEGLRYLEIADELACPVGTVMSRLHRARARLRGLLQEETPPARRPRRARAKTGARRPAGAARGTG